MAPDMWRMYSWAFGRQCLCILVASIEGRSHDSGGEEVKLVIGCDHVLYKHVFAHKKHDLQKHFPNTTPPGPAPASALPPCSTFRRGRDSLNAMAGHKNVSADG